MLFRSVAMKDNLDKIQQAAEELHLINYRQYESSDIDRCVKRITEAVAALKE